MTEDAPRTALVGRDEEIGRLSTLLAEARSGTPHTAVIGGEAGIGKTRLVGELVAHNSEGTRVLTGPCIDLGEAGGAYAPIVAALRPLLDDLGAQRVREITGAGHASIAGLFGAAEETPAGPGSTGQLHEAVAVLLEQASRDRPILLIIEDLHWVDAATLGVIRFLTRMIRTGRILTVLTYRSEDVGRGHPVRDFLAELTRDRDVTRIELERLGIDDTRTLVEGLTGRAPAESALETLRRRSDGVPFYIEELADLEDCEDARALPGTLRELLLVRYERLSDAAQRLARLLAVGGVETDQELVGRVADGTSDDIETPMREAVHAGLLVATDTGYRFRHALMREAILDDLLPGERERLHERYAHAYEELAERDSRSLAAAVAHHWTGARDAARAFPAWIRAMREARTTLAYAPAAQHAERALSLWEVVPDAEAVAGMGRLELMGRASTYLRNAGDTERSLAMANAGLDECPSGTLDHALLLKNRARALGDLMRPGSGEAYRTALATLDALDDEGTDAIRRVRADVMIALGSNLMIAGQRDEALQLALDGAELAEELGDRRLLSIAVNISARMKHDDAEAAYAEMQRAWSLAGDDGNAQLRYWVNASDLAERTGEHRRAADLALEGLRAARSLGMERTSGTMLANNAAEPLYVLGEWERADALSERALSLDPTPSARSYLVGSKAWSLLWRGDRDAAERLIAAHRAIFDVAATLEIQSLLGAGRVRTEIALAHDDLAGAWRSARVMFMDDPRALDAGYLFPFAWAAARTIARAGASGDEALAEAADHGPRLLELCAMQSWWPTHDVWMPFVRAELSSDPEHWRAAVESAQEPAASVEMLPYALMRLGEAHLAEGDRQAARDPLGRAREEARRRGIGALYGPIEELAGSAGVSPASPPGRERTRITARERQVLDLVAEGLSNRQIGERLFISTKTASVHVSAILRKLGASSRTEAARLARSPAPADEPGA